MSTRHGLWQWHRLYQQSVRSDADQEVPRWWVLDELERARNRMDYELMIRGRGPMPRYPILIRCAYRYIRRYVGWPVRAGFWNSLVKLIANRSGNNAWSTIKAASVENYRSNSPVWPSRWDDPEFSPPDGKFYYYQIAKRAKSLRIARFNREESEREARLKYTMKVEARLRRRELEAAEIRSLTRNIKKAMRTAP